MDVAKKAASVLELTGPEKGSVLVPLKGGPR